MHKSIFKRIKDYRSNPINEYLKISSFVGNKDFTYNESFYLVFRKMFSRCEPLRGLYTDFDDCISENVGFLGEYQFPVSNDVFDNFEEYFKEGLLDSFLTYIEIIFCLLFVARTFGPSYYGQKNINKPAINQLLEMIDISLNSLNYKIEDKDVMQIEIIKIDPLSEEIAKNSPKEIKIAILNYLSLRDGDLVGKEKALHDIVDLLEPAFKKYGNNEIIHSAKEYAQIIRHPKIKEKDNEYEWFFKNKKVFLDKMFQLCIYTQNYLLSKDCVDELSKMKSNK